MAVKHTALEELSRRARQQWEAVYGGENPVILVGDATCGRAAGSQAVIGALKKELDRLDVKATLLVTGCAGICSCEPLVTILKPGEFPVCYHHVTLQMVPQLVERYLLGDDPCLELALGTVDKNEDGAYIIPELERFSHEKRILLCNCGYLSPLEISHYIAAGRYAGLDSALGMRPAAIIAELKKSGLRGRGGAGYPAYRKWKVCRETKSRRKYVICNADEGDPGAFMDRVLLESDPHAMLEGMTIAAYAVGASQGYVYIREEYPLAIERLNTAIWQAGQAGLLGHNILGSGFDFKVEIVKGAGAFVSGEETALIAALEGRRSWPVKRPPYPAEHGLDGKPTLVNNVKTLALVPAVIRQGGDRFKETGTMRSSGTALFALAGKLCNTGLAEVPMGTTLRSLVYGIGGGTKQGKAVKAVQIGGPSGGCLPASMLDTPIDFDSLKKAGAMMGSGGVIVMDEDNCMVDTARFFTDFSQRESCGKCTHCRIGTVQMLGLLDDITAGKGTLKEMQKLKKLARDVRDGSLCGLGRMAPNPVLTTLRYFREEYRAHIVEKRCPARVCKELTAYYILPERCEKGCDHCVLACPAEAIFSDEKGIKVIEQEKCTKCSSCELVCPQEYNAVIRLSPVSLVPEDRRRRPDKPSGET